MESSLYMQRCIDLALSGLGSVAPNPMVGAVLVYDNRIIGEGFHAQYGQAHAEKSAIDAVKKEDKHLIPASTLYVCLEPCVHFGKTPPCSDLIIQNKIKKVVVGCTDPFEKVAGKGIEKLRQAGVEVELSSMEKKCLELNKRFFTFHLKRRPYIILKWAQTANGFISSYNKADEKWISGPLAQTLVHKWRSEEPGIMVGTNTALMDNPELTVRHWKGKNPLRISLDKDLRLPDHLCLFDQKNPSLIFTSKFKESSENLRYEQINFSGNIFSIVVEKLHQMNIQSVLVEGGTQLLNGFIASGLWDEARVFTNAKIFNDGVKAPSLNADFVKKDKSTVLLDDTLSVYTNSALHT
jgi:diaminohydroxyphosphoribosylaminopyrimidine deaminase/5-amino-6-(5-phosphoribosylamino)uracil reductase